MKNTNKNIIFNVLKTVFSIIFPIITIHYATKTLGTIGVGKINFTSSIISYFSIFASLGMQVYAIRECSKVLDNKEKLNKVASELFSINLISTFIVYIVLAITLLANSTLKNYKALIIIESLQLIITTLGTDWINIAVGDYKYITIRTILFQILAIILMFVFVKDSTHYIRYAFIMSFITNGYYLINIFYRSKYCDIKFSFSINIKKHWKPIFIMFISMLFQTIFNNIDITIIGFIFGDEKVGIYSIAVKIINLVNQVISSIAFVLMPQLSIEFLNKNYKNINSLLRYSLGFIITFGLPCIAGLNCLSTEIVCFIAGESFLEANYYLKILTVSLGLSFVGGFIGNMILIPSGKEKEFLLGGVASIVIDVLICVFFIPRYGLISASVARIAYQLVGIIVALLYLDKRIKIYEKLDLLFVPAVESVCIFIIKNLINRMFDNYIIILFGTMIISLIIYVILLIVLKNKFFREFISLK